MVGNQRILHRFFYLYNASFPPSKLKLAQGPSHTMILMNENSERIFTLKIFWKKIPSSQSDQLYQATTDCQLFQVSKNQVLVTTNIKSTVFRRLRTRCQRKKLRNKLAWKSIFWSSVQVRFKLEPVLILEYWNAP